MKIFFWYFNPIFFPVSEHNGLLHILPPTSTSSPANFLSLGGYLPSIAKPVASRPHQHQQFSHHLLLAAAAAHCRPHHQPYLTGKYTYLYIGTPCICVYTRCGKLKTRLMWFLCYVLYIFVFFVSLPVTTPGGGPGGPPNGQAPQQTTVFPLPGAFPWAHSGRGKPRRGMMRRAVFSDLQRKGLERRFQIQKYISKPDRKKLAEKLGLKDSQVREKINK